MEIDRTRVNVITTWVIRILTGVFFVISGFVKGVDPWGTIYKVDSYLDVMHIQIWPNLELVGVFGLCAYEFAIGAFLILGCFRKSTPIMGAILMTFMLPLSVWIAINDPVSDCGCFGDAIILSNTATLIKNILITGGIVWLLKYNTSRHWMITPSLQWIAMVATVLCIITFELYGFLYQPLIDFRDFGIGKRLMSEETNDDVPEYRFIYEKGDEKIEIGENDPLPEESDGWKFLERRELYPDNKVLTGNDSNDGLRVWDVSGNEELTSELKEGNDSKILVMIPDLRRVSPASTWKLNSMYEWSLSHGVDMIAVVAGTKEEIEEWKDLSMAEYLIYSSEDTKIKEVVRGNPGIVYVKDDKIVWKSTLNSIMVDDFQSPEISSDASTFGRDNRKLIRNILLLYVILIVILILISFIPIAERWYRIRKHKKETEAEIGSEDNIEE